jgi:pyruvate/oxaloacetate carboxyltransferase
LGGEYMKELKRIVENPLEMLVWGVDTLGLRIYSNKNHEFTSLRIFHLINSPCKSR